MSLVRLLTAGKSLVGLKEPRWRYQLDSQKLLPKFASKRNPFRGTALPEDVQTATATPATAEIVQHEAPCGFRVTTDDENGSLRSSVADQGAVEGASEVSQTLRVTADHDNGSLTPSGEESGKVEWMREVPSGLKTTTEAKKAVQGRATVLLSLLRVVFRRRSKPARSANTRLSTGMVQGELSLDTVRVVRNDLSDSDLEIIPAKPVPVGGGGGANRQKVENGSDSTWSRVAGRLFGARKSVMG